MDKKKKKIQNKTFVIQQYLLYGFTTCNET